MREYKFLAAVLLSALIGVVVACSTGATNGKDKPSNNPTNNIVPAENPEKLLSRSFSGKSVLFDMQKAISFSSKTKSDQFHLKVQGDSLVNSWAWVSIVSYKGDTLFKQSFETMLSATVDTSKKPENQMEAETLVKKQLEIFFNPDKFIKPAIATTEKYAQNYTAYIDKKSWNAIKNNPEAIGFKFQTAANQIKYLAYEKDSNRALVYYSAD
ncbi:MAG: hypothetical protein IPG29_15885 [Sphingobacteriales bacterium]|nr:hypothetical protein [Sphingobacteriales bacterium]